MKYPDDANKVWRDMGVMIRGFLFKKQLDYRIAMTNGVTNGVTVAATHGPGGHRRTAECPRFSGRLAYNVFDAEEGFFLGGTYLGKKKVLSVGFAYDYQPGVFGKDVRRQAATTGASAATSSSTCRMGKNRLSGQLNFVGYGGDNAPDPRPGACCSTWLRHRQSSRSWPWTVPARRQEARGDSTGYMDIDRGFDSDLFGAHLGLNWWFLGHTANVKLDVGFIKNYGVEVKNSATVVTLQTQLYL